MTKTTAEWKAWAERLDLEFEQGDAVEAAYNLQDIARLAAERLIAKCDEVARLERENKRLTRIIVDDAAMEAADAAREASEDDEWVPGTCARCGKENVVVHTCKPKGEASDV